LLTQDESDQDWAEEVHARIRVDEFDDSDDAEEIYLYPFAITPAEFTRALLEGPELAHVRQALSSSDYECVLPESGAKVFVKPHQYQGVLDAIKKKGCALRPSHVIVSASLLPELEPRLPESHRERMCE